MTRRLARSDDDPATLLAESRGLRLKDRRGAARLSIRAIRAARARGDAVLELKAYWSLSAVASLERRWGAVLAIVDRALLCEAAQGDGALRARTLLGRGSALIHAGQIDAARRDAEAALPVLQRAADAQGEAAAHATLATAAAEVGDHAGVIRHVADQRRALGTAGAPSALAAAEINEGIARIGLFDFGPALRLFESACARFESVGGDVEAAHARYNCAYLHLKSGRFAEALRLHARVAETFARERIRVLLGALAVDRSELLLEIGAVAEARGSARQALDLATGSLSAKDTLRTRQILAVAALHGGDAEAAYDAAVAVAEEFIGFPDACGAAESLVVASSAALALGDADEAARCASEAAALFEDAGTGATACAADFAACRAALELGRIETADSLLVRAESRDGFSALPWVAVEWNRHRAMVLAARGDVAGAAATLDRAVGDLERRRALLPPDALRSAFFSRHAPLYREAVDAHVRAGLDVRAFELATAAKSRSLLDLMAGGANLDPSDAPRLDGLRTDLSAAYARLQDLSYRQGSPAAFAAARAETTRLERAAADVVAQALNRSDGGTISLPPQHAADLQAALADGAVLVEYASGGAELHAFVVSRDQVRRVGLRVEPRALEDLLRKVDFQMSFANVPGLPEGGDGSPGAIRGPLAELRALLIDPLGLPADTRHVVVAPDPSLQDVPFHAFPAAPASDPGAGPSDGWWAETVLISYAPSAMVHAVCARGPARAAGPAHVFAVTDESVPEIRSEAAQVAAALGPTTVVRADGDATWAQFVVSAGSAGLLHVATHGLARTGSQIGGSLRLADCWLTQFDLYRLRVHADLVVLSACDSGAARVEASGDPFGLVRGFLCAGARRLVTSRWRVDDRTTSEWMGSFYTGLAAGRSVGDAYRDACRAVRKARPHPVHWAPFVLLGDPSLPVALVAARP